MAAGGSCSSHTGIQVAGTSYVLPSGRKSTRVFLGCPHEIRGTSDPQEHPGGHINPIDTVVNPDGGLVPPSFSWYTGYIEAEEFWAHSDHGCLL